MNAGRKSIDYGIESVRLRFLSELYDALHLFSRDSAVTAEASTVMQTEDGKYKKTIKIDLEGDELKTILEKRIEELEKQREIK